MTTPLRRRFIPLAAAAFMACLLPRAARGGEADREEPPPPRAEKPVEVEEAKNAEEAEETKAPVSSAPSEGVPSVASNDPNDLAMRRGRFVRDFGPGDASREEWRTEEETALGLVEIDAAHGESLAVPVVFPLPVQAWRGSRTDPVKLIHADRLGEARALVLRTLQYEVYVPPDVPPALRVQSRLLVKNKDGLWFEGLGRRREIRPDGTTAWVPATALFPGWNTIRVDLGDRSVDMRPRGHGMRWSRFFLSQVVSVGFALQGDGAFRGMCALDTISTWPATDTPADPAANLFREPMDFVHLEDGGGTVARYGRAEIAFDLNRPVLNPFDTGELRIDAVFATPDGGTTHRVPAFYDQPYHRIRGDDEATGAAFRDRYVPVGPGRYKVRFTPRETGNYTYRLEARYRSRVSGAAETVETSPRRLRVAPGPGRGFLRVSPEDPRCFAFEDGTYFFPVGHSFRSPTDARHVKRILNRFYPEEPAPRDRGLRAYEDLLPRMAAAGVNTVEVWMASWWLALEWTGRWKDYHGLHVYNTKNAWILDRLIDLAAEHGLYLHLVVDNHGKAAQKAPGAKQGQFDHEWEFSPYNAENDADGGFLTYAIKLFEDERAMALYRDKLRYIAARYGWSTHILGVELWSELDLVGHKPGRHLAGVYGTKAVHAWHRAMTAHFRAHDHGRHPLTTHYSGDYRYLDRTMIGFPFIDYIVLDAYHAPNTPLLDTLRQTEAVCMNYSKPYLVTEFGGDWNASSLEGLDGDLYAGLWFGWTSRMAGTPLYWWFELLALRDGYPAYAGLSRFIEGEDKRRGPDAPPLRTDWACEVRRGDKESAALDALVLGDGASFYAWVYDKPSILHLPEDMADRRRLEGAAFRLADAEPGAYAVEVWNSWTGTITSRALERTDGKGGLTVALPPFRTHCALKIRRASALEELDGESGAEGR